MYNAQLRKYFSLLLPFIFLFLPLTGHTINLGPPPSDSALLNVPGLAPTAPTHGLSLLPDLRVVPGSLSYSPDPVTPGGVLHISARVENLDNEARNRVRVRFTCGKKHRDIFVSLAQKERKKVQTAIQLNNASGVQAVSVEVNPIHSELEEGNYRNNLVRRRVMVKKNKSGLATAASGIGQARPEISLNKPAPFPVLTNVEPDTLTAGQSYTLQLQGRHLNKKMRLDFGPGITQQGPLQTTSFGDRRLYLARITVARTARPGLRTIAITNKGRRHPQRPILTVLSTLDRTACRLKISPARLEPGRNYQLTIFGCNFPDRLSADFDRNEITVKNKPHILSRKEVHLPIHVAADARPGEYTLTLHGKQHSTATALMVAPPYLARGVVQVVAAAPAVKPGPAPGKVLVQPMTINRISPSPLQQGRRYLLNIQGHHFDRSMTATLDKGIKAVGKLRFISPEKVLLQVEVAENARISNHVLTLKNEGRQSPSLMVAPGSEARATLLVKAAPFTAPTLTTTRPQLSPRPQLMLLTPNHWLAGKKYNVTATGSHLDRVADISFGPSVWVRHLDHQGSSTLTFTVQVDESLKADVRFARLTTGRKKPLKTNVPAWILRPVHLAKVPTPRWSITEQMQIRKGAIYLENPEWYGTGDVAGAADYPVPLLNDATVFNWREEIPGLAKRFEIRFLTPRGTLIMARPINLGHPAMNITSYKPGSRVIMELFRQITGGLSNTRGLAGDHKAMQGMKKTSAKVDLLRHPERSEMGVRTGLKHPGSQHRSVYEDILSDPVFNHLASRKEGSGNRKKSRREEYFDRHKKDIDLVWQVVGFRSFATAPAHPAGTTEGHSDTGQPGLQQQHIFVASDQGGNRETTEIMVEESEQWPLRLPDQWPDGVSCDQNSRLDLSVDYQKPESWHMDQDPNHYPGENIILAGKGVSINSSPWAISADTNYKGGKYFEDDSYAFNNVIIDWGDGSWQPLRTKAVPSADTNNPGDVPGWQSTNAMNFQAKHKYSAPGKFAIRIYVVPQDQMGEIDRIVASHRYVPPEQTAAADRRQPVLLADSGMIVSDSAPGYGIRENSAGPAGSISERSDARIFMLYCNPIPITIIQDTDATGPLHLDSVAITSFSSDTSFTGIGLEHDIRDTARNLGRRAGSEKGGKPAMALAATPRSSLSPAPPTQVAKVNKPGAGLANASITADTTVSTCEGGLWAKGALRYYGQGYARIKWLVDDVVVKSRDIKIGPSELRTNLNSPDRSTWGDPLLSSFQLDSPRLPVKETGLHRVRITAEVIPDPTFSMVNAVALRSRLPGELTRRKKGSSRGSVSQAMPVVGKTSLKPAFLPGPVGEGRIKSSWHRESGAIMDVLRSSAGNNRPLKPGDIFMAPYAVRSPVKRYKVVEHSGDMPCRFLFPVKKGEFEVISLKHLTRKGESYSGQGQFIFKLPDGPHSVSEHYTAISFTGWQADGQGAIVQGSLDTRAAARLDALPGMKAKLTALKGTARDEVQAVMDVEVGDTTIRLIGAEKPQKWAGVSAPLTPDGDWYATGLKLGESLIGWSMTSIESTDVRLDLSKSEGNAPAGAYGGADWVGINLGQATLHPYLFDLADMPIEVQGWNIIADGLNGQAETGAFSHVFGEGSIGWSNLKINAFHSSLNATYKDFYVEMAWPKIRLEGKNTHYSYSPGSQVDVQLGLDTNLPEVTEQYDHIDMKVMPKAFQHYNSGWGLMTDTEFTFRDEQGGLFADHVIVNDLLFTIMAEAEYNGPDIPLNIKGQVGGADELITGVRPTAGGKGDRKLNFDFTSELSMEGIGRAEAPVHIMYGINHVTNRDAWDEGPDHPDEIVLKSHFPETNQAADNEFRVKYQHGPAQVACQPGPVLYAASDTIASDGWPSYPLLALNGSISGGGCGNDTFGGTIDTHMFGSGTPAITGTFRFGEQNGSRYWLGFLKGDNLHIPIYASIFIEMIQGGMAYNFDHDAFTRNNGFDACPAPGKGLLFSAGLGLSVSGPDTIRADGILTIQPSDSFYELYGHALLFEKADLKGRLRYYQSAFDGEIWGNISLLNNKLYLEAQEHSCGIHVDSGKWFFHAGTENNMIHGYLLELNGGVFLMLDSDKGLRAGGMLVKKVDKQSDGFGVKGHANFNGAVELHLHPLGFDGKISGDLGGKFINPIRDIDFSVGTDLWLGCCSPVKFGYGFHVSCCCVKGGADIHVLPSPSFHPWVKCNCCPCCCCNPF